MRITTLLTLLMAFFASWSISMGQGNTGNWKTDFGEETSFAGADAFRFQDDDAVADKWISGTNLLADLGSKVQTLTNKTIDGFTLSDAITVTGTDHHGIALVVLTTGQRDALTGLAAGDGPIWNSTTTQAEIYNGSSWVAIGSGGSGDVATDTIWDAAGDLAVGSGADTASKLTMGSALQVLRVNSGATGLEWAAAASGGVTTRTAIVRVGAAGTWTLLDDANHEPLGIASIAQDSGAKTITLTYDTAITGKVYSSSCDVDETLAGTFDAGVSVGSTTAVITIRAIGGARGRVYRSGGSWTFDVKDSSNVAWSPSGWSGADDHYRLDDCPDWLFMSGVVIGTRQSTFLASNKATNNTNGSKRVDVDFRDYDGTLQTNQQDGMGFNIYIPPLTTDIDPALINSVDFTDGNIWVTILSED